MTLGARGWVLTLWGWWLTLGLLGLTLIAVAFFNSARATLERQASDLQAPATALGEAFVTLGQRQLEVPLALFEDVRADRLTRDRLVGQRLLGAPFFKLYYVDGEGRAVLAGDRAEPLPGWIQRLLPAIGQSRGLVPLRPLPGVARPPGTPEAYLLWVARGPKGRTLVAETDLAVVFGPWLAEQLRATPLPAGTQAQVLSPAATWARPKSPEGEKRHDARWLADALTGAPLPAARVATFFRDDPAPFQAVVLQPDARLTLADGLRTHVLMLAAFVLVMGSFAGSLHLAGRTVRRELALADARANFTAMVSHELKTPVAAIRMYGEILVEKLVDGAASADAYHRIILDQAMRLQRLIENLLDLGKIEAGGRTFENAAQDLNGLVEDAIAQALAATPADAAHRLTRALAAGSPRVWADADAACQAIANLVHNALKYGGTPAEVDVATFERAGAVCVAVSDRGPGIPAARRAAIFEPYVRLETEARRETQGTGLGLALVKGYMAGQGGAVEVAAREGGGSVFTLVFRAAPEVAEADMTKT